MMSWRGLVDSLLRRRGGETGRECPYCFPLVQLSESKYDGCLKCPACDGRFARKRDGRGRMEIEPILPAMPSEPTPSRRTCIPLEQGRLQLERESLLCRTCQHHQSILLQLLSAYEVPVTMDEARELAHYQQHKEDLERRYPLCGACRARVQERLRVVEYKVRGRRLASRGKSIQALEVRRKRDVALWKRSIMFFDIFGIQGLIFGGAWALDFVYGPGVLCSLPWALYLSLRLLIIFLDIGLVLLHRPRLLRWTCLAVLLLFRMVLVNTVRDGSIHSHDIRSLPFIILNMASMALLVQIHQADRQAARRLGTLERNPFSTSSVDLPLTPIIKRPDLLNKESISWDRVALEKLDPTTPLSTRFTDLSCAPSAPSSLPSLSPGNPYGSPFAVPNLLFSDSCTTTPKPAASPPPLPPPSLPPPRPGFFDGARTSGLESYFEGFSLEGGSAQRKTPQGSTVNDESAGMDSLVLTMGLLMARIIVEGHLPLTTMLLILAVALRGSVWPWMNLKAQKIINVCVLLRLTRLVLSYRPGFAPVAAALLDLYSLQLQPLEHVVDAIILLSR